MKRPTREDADLLLRLMETFYNSPYYYDATVWFMRDFSVKDYEEFKSKCPLNSQEYFKVIHVLSFYETAGTLVSHGLLNENLLFDSIDIGFVWNKIENVIPGWQKETSPALWENVVWLAKRHQNWQKKVWKPNQKWKIRPS